jgi:hypothetical protein
MNIDPQAQQSAVLPRGQHTYPLSTLGIANHTQEHTPWACQGEHLRSYRNMAREQTWIRRASGARSWLKERQIAALAILLLAVPPAAGTQCVAAQQAC